MLLCQAPSANPRLGRLPPLSLLYLAAALLEHGHIVSVVDLDLAGCLDPLVQALDESYDVLGITCCTENYHLAQLACVTAKSRAPELKIVFGGPHATALPEEVLLGTPEIDVVVRGEGELPLCELLEAWERGIPLNNVAGLTYRKDDTVVSTDTSPQAQDLDCLPLPAWNLINLVDYTMSCCITARGCAFSCNFCAGRTVSPTYRYRSPENVARELRLLAAITPEEKDLDVQFFDNTFHVSHSWLDALISEMSLLPRKLYWTAELRCDQVRPGLPETLYRAGCRVVRVGVESGSDEVLSRIRKGITVDQSVRAVEACLAAGLVTFATFCIGHPDDTISTVAESVALMKKLWSAGAYVAASIVTPFPGTDLHRNPEAWGIEIVTRDWRRYNLYTPVMNTRHLTASQIGALFMEQIVANGFYSAVPKWGAVGREVVKGFSLGGK